MNDDAVVSKYGGIGGADSGELVACAVTCVLMGGCRKWGSHWSVESTYLR